MDELAVMFLCLSAIVSLVGLLAFWDRPSHHLWATMAMVSTVALLAVWSGREVWGAMP